MFCFVWIILVQNNTNSSITCCKQSKLPWFSTARPTQILPIFSFVPLCFYMPSCSSISPVQTNWKMSSGRGRKRKASEISVSQDQLDPSSLSDLTVFELKKLLKARGVKSGLSLTKPELIRKLRSVLQNETSNARRESRLSQRAENQPARLPTTRKRQLQFVHQSRRCSKTVWFPCSTCFSCVTWLLSRAAVF